MRAAVGLMLLTLLLTAGGCVLYVIGFVGWAQALWVFASGSAGGAIMAFADSRG